MEPVHQRKVVVRRDVNVVLNVRKDADMAKVLRQLSIALAKHAGRVSITVNGLQPEKDPLEPDGEGACLPPVVKTAQQLTQESHVRNPKPNAAQARKKRKPLS